MRQELYDFADATEDVLDQLDLIYEIEQLKRKALLARDVKEVNRLTTKQQSMTLQLESTENRRVQAQKKAGFGELTCNEILLKISLEEEDLLKPLFEDLIILADELQEINKKSLEMAKSELRIVNAASPIDPNDTVYNPFNRAKRRNKEGYTFEDTF